jgi:hypothetical protein
MGDFKVVCRAKPDFKQSFASSTYSVEGVDTVSNSVVSEV